MADKVHLLESFCNPRSIALFGSMQENWFFGAAVIIGDLLKWNYTGRIYPIHPSAQTAVSYTHLRAHETVLDLVCRLLLEKKKNNAQS